MTDARTGPDAIDWIAFWDAPPTPEPDPRPCELKEAVLTQPDPNNPGQRRIIAHFTEPICATHFGRPCPTKETP